MVFTLCHYPCRLTSCCGAQTEKLITGVFPACLYEGCWLEQNSIWFSWNDLNWTGTPSFSLKLVLFSHSPVILPTLYHNFPTPLSTLHSHEPLSTQQPPVPVQIKTLYPLPLKASFLFCIFRTTVFLWTAVLITLPAPVHSSQAVSSLYWPSFCNVHLRKSMETALKSKLSSVFLVSSLHQPEMWLIETSAVLQIYFS